MSDLQDVHEEYADKGVRVFALNVPAFNESQATLAAFVEQAGLTYPVLNHAGTLFEINFAGSNGFPYPRDALIGPDGTVVFTSKQYDAQHVRDLIRQLIAERDGDE